MRFYTGKNIVFAHFGSRLILYKKGSLAILARLIILLKERLNTFINQMSTIMISS